MKNWKQIGDRFRVAGIESAIALSKLCDTLEDIQMNTNMAKVNKLISAPPLPPNKSKYHK